MVKALEDIIAKSSSIVFFGGAGVSTESGIPDFRSVDGLYHQKYDYPPETILSHTFWEKKPEEFYRFYRDKLIVKGAKPNAAHLRLAKLEQQGKLRAVVTQNIDGLHPAAGSKTVYEDVYKRQTLWTATAPPVPTARCWLSCGRTSPTPPRCTATCAI